MEKKLSKHFTASMYVTSFIDEEVKVFLHLHDKLQIWLGVGGHIEVNENPVQAALREAQEELGVAVELIVRDKLLITPDVIQIPSPYFVLEEHIPGINGMSEHIHMDFIYFGYLKNYKNVSMKEQFGWFTKQDLKKIKLQFEVSKIAPMAIEEGRHYIKSKIQRVKSNPKFK